MGFMDKVKAAAQDAAEGAKKATAQAQSKVEQGQIRKKMDESARELGYLVYYERTQGAPPGARADELVSELAGLHARLQEEEREAEAAAAAAAQQPAPPPGPAAGTPPAPAPNATPPGPAPAATPPPPVSTSSSEPTSGDFTL